MGFHGLLSVPPPTIMHPAAAAAPDTMTNYDFLRNHRFHFGKIVIFKVRI
jgi:hypothetical protein